MQITGIIICALVGIRLLQSIGAAFQSHRARKTSAAQAALLLDEQIAAIQALRIRREHQHLHWDGYRKFRVCKKVTEAEGTTSLYLTPHDKKPLPIYRPGQYLTFRFQVPGDKPDKLNPVVRCYSLSDAPHADHFRITVRRVPPPPGTNHPPGQISNYVQDCVNVGDILDVQAPRGEFVLDPHGTNPVVLIGGGVGITPVLSMLNATIAAGSDREVWFFYGVRNGADHIMQQHLQKVADTHANVHLHVCYSQPAATDETAEVCHATGHLTPEMIRNAIKVNNFDFYICGPPPMMNSLVPALREWGVKDSQIHTEAFGPATVKKPARQRKAASNSVTDEMAVRFSRSGKTVLWDGSAENLLDLAQSNGITIESGCRAGSCGTCLVAVKEGKTSSSTGTDANDGNGSCLACVSFPVTDIILDA